MKYMLKKFIGISAAVSSAFFLFSCSGPEAGSASLQKAAAADQDAAAVSTKGEAETVSAADFPAETSAFSPKLLSEAEAILSGATCDFIGHHPINENFIFYVADSCGEGAIDAIASGGNFSDPEVWYQATGQSIHVLWDSYCRQTGISYYQTRRTRVLDTGGKAAKFVFTGDIGMGENLATTNYLDLCENGLSDCFSADLLSEMKGADVLTINNEFPYTDRGTPIPDKAYTFRARPERVKELEKIGVDLVSIANNHVFDYGDEGIQDTFTTLEQAGLPYIGAGRNIEDASEPYSFIACGRKIAICSATQIERSSHYTQEATDTLPGVLKTLNPTRFCAEIRKAKRSADIVLVFVHWGTEGNSAYGTDQTALAEAFVSAGADAIIGGHTHCLQAVEYVEGVPCFYSLGNYWFSPTGAMPDRYDTGLAELVIDGNGIEKVSFLPCYFENGVTSETVDEGQRQAELSYLNALSQTAVISADGTITQK